MKRISVSGIRALKASALVLGLAASVVAGGVTGCAGNRSNQTAGERGDDNGDSSRVREALRADTQYNYDAVNVDTFNGVVQLSGSVDSRDQKNRAGDLSQSTEGVRGVKNKLFVRTTAASNSESSHNMGLQTSPASPIGTPNGSLNF